MADYFCDHENSTLYPTAYMTPPATSADLPQEGDGKAIGTTTPAVASCSFSVASSTAAAGATITVCGATLTCVASGATSVQFNAGTGATLATNLAAAINAATPTVTTADGNIASPYLKSMVWAQASGTTVNIYTRIASATLNAAANAANAAVFNVTGWTSPPATANMTGGVSGPFRYLFNIATLAALSAGNAGTQGLYGALAATIMGNPGAGDKVYIRTKRSGSNILITLPTTTITVQSRVGTQALPLMFIADNGVKWSGDAGVLTITMDGSLTSNKYIGPLSTTGGHVIWAGTRLTDTTCNWKFEVTGVPQVGNYALNMGPVSPVDLTFQLWGMQFGGATDGPMNNTNAAYAYIRFIGPLSSIASRDDSRFVLRDVVHKTKSGYSPIMAGSSTYNSDFRVENCLFDHTGLTTAAPEAIVGTTGGTISYSMKLAAVGTRWIGLPALANLSGAQKSAGTAYNLILNLIDCSIDNIKVCGGTANGGLVGSTDPTQPWADMLRSISVVSTLGNRPFVFENTRRSFAWVDSATPKTTSSLLPDGTTNFSVRCAVTSESGLVAPLRPVRMPRLKKHNTLADGNRTAAVRFLCDNNIKTALGSRDPYNSEIWIVFTYIGTDGLLKTVTTWAGALGTPASLSAGVSGDWSAVQYDVNGVTHYYSPYAISASLPLVKSLTEVGAELYIGCQSASVDNLLFVDPDWSLT